MAGGESGGGAYSSEVYDPRLDPWTFCLNPGVQFYDNISEVLPEGRVLIAPVQPTQAGLTLIFEPGTNPFIIGPSLYRGYDQDEASWVKLSDNSILTVDPYGTNSKRYIPGLNAWIDDSNVPVPLYDLRNFEIGAALLRPNGKAFFLGATGNTALYSPTGTTNMGQVAGWAGDSRRPGCN